MTAKSFLLFKVHKIVRGILRVIKKEYYVVCSRE